LFSYSSYIEERMRINMYKKEYILPMRSHVCSLALLSFWMIDDGAGGPFCMDGPAMGETAGLPAPDEEPLRDGMCGWWRRAIREEEVGEKGEERKTIKEDTGGVI
jgi:hypothetical protein